MHFPLTWVLEQLACQSRSGLSFGVCVWTRARSSARKRMQESEILISDEAGAGLGYDFPRNRNRTTDLICFHCHWLLLHALALFLRI